MSNYITLDHLDQTTWSLLQKIDSKEDNRITNGDIENWNNKSYEDLTNKPDVMIKGEDYVTAGQQDGEYLGYKATAEGNFTIASGPSSHAEGYNTIASNYDAHAEGDSTEASGYAAHAEGANTIASENHSHAEGSNTLASGFNSHAEGVATVASGANSHAEGSYATATGQNSHAEGWGTIASGRASHAEGYQTTAAGFCSHVEGSNVIAAATAAHAEGYSTTATGVYSHAEGWATIAAATAAHAEGSGTTAFGLDSHAEGYSTTASGNYSHVEGQYTIANSRSQHVFGEYNVIDSNIDTSARGNYIEIVGKGSTNYSRSNARTLDWNGNEWLAGTLTVNTAPTTAMHVATKRYVDNYIPSQIQTYVNNGIEAYSVNVRTTTTSVQAVYDDNYVRSSITLKGTGIEISTERFSNEILTIKNNQILGLVDPTTATHAASKNYVDNAIANSSGVTSVNGQTGTVTLTIPSVISNNYSNDATSSNILLYDSNSSSSTVTSTKTSGALSTISSNHIMTLQIGKAHSDEGSQGRINLSNANVNRNYTTITPSATAAITLTLPSTTGTLALTTDIPAATTITNTLSSGTIIATINGTNIYLPIYDGTVV